jgi:hypothetical protein
VFVAYHPKLGRFLQKDPLGLVDGWNLYAYSNHASGTFTDYYGFTSNEINWSKVALEGAKTLAVGALFIGAGAFVVGAGLASAPYVAAFGITMGLAGGIMSYYKQDIV